MTTLLVACWASPVGAQEESSPASDSRFRVGFLGLTPTLNIESLGVDTNVFNDPVNAKSDMVATLRPDLGTAMKVGRGVFTTHSWLAYRYFQEYATQRSLSSSTDLRFGLPFKWFKPYVAETLTSLRDRPSPDIDARVRTNVSSTAVGMAFNVGPRATLDFSTRRTVTSFGQDETFLGTNLAQQLNQVATELSGSFGYRITPVTTAVISVLDQHNGFKSASGRDSGSIVVVGGAEFGHTGPIGGRATVGFRQFKVNDTRVANFSGPIVGVDLSYVIRGSTQFLVKLGRDVAYSFSPTEPYYLLTTISGTINQQVSDRIAVSGGYTRQLLNYRRLIEIGMPEDLTVIATGLISQINAGVSVRLSPSARLSIGVEKAQRPAGHLEAYQNFRILSGVSYGF